MRSNCNQPLLVVVCCRHAPFQKWIVYATVADIAHPICDRIIVWCACQGDPCFRVHPVRKATTFEKLGATDLTLAYATDQAHRCSGVDAAERNYAQENMFSHPCPAL